MNQFTTLLFLAAWTGLPTHASTASPAERIFLTNCRACDSCPWAKSAAAYYVSNAAEVEGAAPDAVADLGAIVEWEGHAVTGKFSGGDAFSSQIRSDGQRQPPNAVAGQATKGDQLWSCVNGMTGPHGLAEVFAMSKEPPMMCFLQYECTRVENTS